VICDIHLPEAPPFAVLDALAQDPATATLPVLVCSGAVEALATAGERLGGRWVRTLAKPFDIDELVGLVAALRRAAGAGPDAPA
jgi:CheY-like chemotaxis protein